MWELRLFFVSSLSAAFVQVQGDTGLHGWEKWRQHCSCQGERKSGCGSVVQDVWLIASLWFLRCSRAGKKYLELGSYHNIFIFPHSYACLYLILLCFFCQKYVRYVMIFILNCVPSFVSILHFSVGSFTFHSFITNPIITSSHWSLTAKDIFILLVHMEINLLSEMKLSTSSSFHSRDMGVLHVLSF